LIDPFPKSAVKAAVGELWLLDAVELQNPSKYKRPRISNLGTTMLKFPVDPRYSKMILESFNLGCMPEMLHLVSILCTEQLFLKEPSSGLQDDEENNSSTSRIAKFSAISGDFQTYVNVSRMFKTTNDKGKENFCEENCLNYRALVYAEQVRAQLLSLCSTIPSKSNVSAAGKSVEDNVCQVAAEGLFMNAAQRQPDGSYSTIASKLKVWIHPSSSLFKRNPEYVVYVELVETTKKYMRHVSRIDEEWIKPKLEKLRKVMNLLSRDNDDPNGSAESL
jgi:ATP-dependent RNA helicase DHX33